MGSKLRSFLDDCYFDVMSMGSTSFSRRPINIANPGALRRKAAAAGAITRRGTINRNWLRSMLAAARRGDLDARTARQVRFAANMNGVRVANSGGRLPSLRA